MEGRTLPIHVPDDQFLDVVLGIRLPPGFQDGCPAAPTRNESRVSILVHFPSPSLDGHQGVHREERARTSDYCASQQPRAS